jgi:hypothetical protein
MSLGSVKVRTCQAPVGVWAQDILDGLSSGDVLTTLGVGSCAGDVKSGDGFEVSSWTYGDLFFAVQDAQMRVFDDDGDDLTAVTGAEFDVLAGDHNAAAGVDLSLCSQ